MSRARAMEWQASRFLGQLHSTCTNPGNHCLAIACPDILLLSKACMLEHKAIFPCSGPALNNHQPLHRRLHTIHDLNSVAACWHVCSDKAASGLQNFAFETTHQLKHSKQEAVGLAGCGACQVGSPACFKHRGDCMQLPSIAFHHVVERMTPQALHDVSNMCLSALCAALALHAHVSTSCTMAGTLCSSVHTQQWCSTLMMSHH